MNALDDPATAGLHKGPIPVSAAEGVEARHLPACPTPELRRHYIASSARAVTSIVADYRATAGIDLDMERTDRAAGRQLGRPVGVIFQDWGSQLGLDPTTIWGAWAPDLTYEPIDAGHFTAEEEPATVTDFVRRLLAR
jgi:haloacetate dehalogenase